MHYGMITRNLILLLTIVFSCSSLFAQTKQAKTVIDSIEKVILANLDNLDIEGIAYALVDTDSTLWSKGFGYADKKSKCQMTDTSITNFASVSKPLTAVGIMMLDQRKIIDIHNPVEFYLKSWKLPNTNYDKSKVTIENILKHRAGLSLMSAPFFDGKTTPPTVKDVLDGNNSESKPVYIKFLPDSTWSYSGGGYAMLELMTEDVTSTRFFSFMQSNLFSPLGMQHSSFEYIKTNQFCGVKNYNEKGKPIKPYFTVAAAAGGLNSTSRDMGLLIQEIIKMYSGKSHLLSKESFHKMIHSTTPVDLSKFGIDEKGVACGLGLFVHHSKDDVVIYHSGGNPGVIAYIIVSLEKEKGLVLVSNSDNARPLVQKVLQLWGQLNNVSMPYFF
jgi:CubicO group peptidase (beta-lactamase class C family)